MEYQVKINGIDVAASYSDEEIDGIFAPFLRRLSELHAEKGRRILVLLAAPPGAGKSTLVSFLEYLAGQVIPDKKVRSVGMDGFHRQQEYLLTHFSEVEGKRLRMVDIKGAPITFDLDALKAKIREVRSGVVCGWPVYDRMLHNPVEDAVLVDGDIVILEGNYLLLDVEGWRDLSEDADFTVSIAADPDMLRTRLLARKIASGAAPEVAERFVNFSDMANVRLCLDKTKPADLQLRVTESGRYMEVAR